MRISDWSSDVCSSDLATTLDLAPQLAPGRYAELVAAAQDYIVAGDLFQVVLAQRFTAPFALPPFELYRALRRVNPSPSLSHLDLPRFALPVPTPETPVLRRDGAKSGQASWRAGACWTG